MLLISYSLKLDWDVRDTLNLFLLSSEASFPLSNKFYVNQYIKRCVREPHLRLQLLGFHLVPQALSSPPSTFIP